MFDRSKYRAQKIREKNPPVVVVPYQPKAIESETKLKEAPRMQFAQVHAKQSDVDRVKQKIEREYQNALEYSQRQQREKQLIEKDRARTAKMRGRNRKIRSR